MIDQLDVRLSLFSHSKLKFTIVILSITSPCHNSRLVVDEDDLK